MKDTYSVIVDGDRISYSDGFSNILTIRENYSKEEGTALMELSGRLPSQLRYALMDEVMLFITCGMRLKIDFSEVTYFSNACQEVLLDAANRQSQYKLPGDFELVNVPEDIYSELKHKHYVFIVRTSKKGGKA